MNLYKNIARLIAILLFMGASSSCINTPEPEVTLFEVLSADNEASIFVQAVQSVGYENALRNGSPITIFAPTNQAFDDFFAANGYDDINDVPLVELRELILYHLLAVSAELSSLGTNYYLTPSPAGPEGNFVAVFTEEENGIHRLNNSSEVTKMDVKAFGGYYNLIDKVLTLPTVYDILEQDEIFSSILAGVNSVEGLKDSLQGTDQFYTFLAIENRDLTADVSRRYSANSLGDLEQTLVNDLMHAHTLRSYLLGRDLVDIFNTDGFPTLLPDFKVSVERDGEILLNDETEALTLNIQATNGVVHIVDKLLPI